MKNIKLTTFAQFSSEEKRNQFNRLVRKAVPKYLAIPGTRKETAIDCAIWDTLQNHRELWYLGPCIEHTNQKPFHWMPSEQITSLFQVIA